MMIHSKQQSLLLLGVVIFLCFVAWILQNALVPNVDVSWDLLATKRLLAGGTYTHDFFDLNPPLIFFIYIPVIIFTKLCSISTAHALRLYVFAMAIGSLALCYALMRSMFLKAQTSLTDILVALLTIIYLIFSVGELGERDHLFIIFTVPYFLAVTYQLQVGTLNRWYALWIGAFAFMGFALKPYFFLPMIFVEVYLMVHRRNVFSWLRIEVMTIMALTVIYLALIFIFYRDYFVTVMPTAMQFYYLSVRDSLPEVLMNQDIFFCCATLIGYVLSYKNNAYKTVSTVFMLTLLGCLCAYLLQQTRWYYHLLPALSIALILLTVLFVNFIQHHRINFPAIVAGTAVLFYIPLSSSTALYTDGLLYKNKLLPLTTFLHTHAQNEPVYMIATNPLEIFPAFGEDYATYASRFLHLFWVPAVVKNNRLHPRLATQQMHDNELLLNRMVCEDIETNKPKFIFVDVKKYKVFYALMKFDYLPYFLKNPEFERVWKQYRYLTTIKSSLLFSKTNGLPLYEFQIYQREDDTVT
jgi:hypothetical protein